MTCKQWPANCFLVKTCRFSCFVLQRTCQCFVPCSWPEALETFGNARLVQRPKARMSLRYAKQIGHANLKSENMFITCFFTFFFKTIYYHFIRTISIHILPSLRGAVGARLTLSWGQNANHGRPWDFMRPTSRFVHSRGPAYYVHFAMDAVRQEVSSSFSCSIDWLNETI